MRKIVFKGGGENLRGANMHRDTGSHERFLSFKFYLNRLMRVNDPANTNMKYSSNVNGKNILFT
jgi:hypothetical protein